MADEVKLYDVRLSPFVYRVKLALNIKGIEYENIEEDLKNKSVELVKYNPVLKQVPVLVHNGRPISESLVIVNYIDDVWKSGAPILPEDPYEKAVARFWAKFIDDECIPRLYKIFRSNEGEEKLVAEACEKLQILEDEMGVKGKKLFGEDNINLVDIAAAFISFWLGTLEEAAEIKFFTKDKFPKLSEWAHNFVNRQVVKEILPPRDDVVAFYKKHVGKDVRREKPL